MQATRSDAITSSDQLRETSRGPVAVQVPLALVEGSVRMVLFPPWRAGRVHSCEPTERLLVRNPRPLALRRQNGND